MIIKTCLFSFLILCFALQASAASMLEQGFLQPSAEVKPRTWFHVMNGNMTKAGITQDLEALKKAGIGGTILFNVSQFIPTGRIKFNSPEHYELIKHMAAESERLGLSFGVHNCDGWTSSGGPWVEIEHSMKRVVTSKTVTDGGLVDLNLPTPDHIDGYYQDIAVLAYPALPGEIEDNDNQPVITSSDDAFDPAIVRDGFTNVASTISKHGESDSANPWVLYQYAKPFDLRTVRMVVKNGRNLALSLSVSDDGVQYTKVRDLTLGRTGKWEWIFDESFPVITAKYFKFEANQSIHLKESTLSSVQQIQQMMARTARARVLNNELDAIGQPAKNMIVRSADIKNLSSNMSTDGKIKTKLPPGKWTLMRVGYTSTGAVNIPASPEGTGYEIDKFSREALKIHYDAYVGRIAKAIKAVAPTAHQYTEIDSYEVGGQNWTLGYDDTFEKQYGYSLLPFLPLYSGVFVDSADVSERVLWDVRELNNTLVTENYYGYFDELANRDGLQSYIEPYGFGPFNDIDAGAKADIPMGEFWLHRNNFVLKAAVSAARIYGKTKVAAEAFTAQAHINWHFHPGMAKLDGDFAWAEGINEFYFHRYAHQANTHVKPGMTMNRWGVTNDRTQTWWDSAGTAWFEYLARGQHLLRQGMPVADVLIFTGDGSPNSCVERKDVSSWLPNFMNYDCVNSDVLMHKLRAQNGKMILDAGNSYRYLVLKDLDALHLSTLEKIHDLSSAGIPIVGTPPKRLAGYGVSDQDKSRFDTLKNAIWQKKTVYKTPSWPAIMTAADALPDLAITPSENVFYTHRKANSADIYFFYNPSNKKQNFDAEFRVANKTPEFWDPVTGRISAAVLFESKARSTRLAIPLEAEQSMFVVFRHAVNPAQRVTALQSTAPAKFTKTLDGRISVVSPRANKIDLTFADGQSQAITLEEPPKAIDVKGPWQVEFLDDYFYGQTHTFEKLLSWPTHPNAEIKQYSGKAIYENAFRLSAKQLSKTRVTLDLGQVEIAARVSVNGKDMGVVWKAPYKMDITQAVAVGENTLKIEVANLWVNKLISEDGLGNQFGYQQATEQQSEIAMPAWYVNNEAPPKGPRDAFTTWDFFDANDPLLPSGLLGPVTINFTTHFEWEQK